MTETDEVYPVKWISFPPGPKATKTPIVMQRVNGPCSFLALCNVLLLTQRITLPPRYSQSVPYSALADILVAFLFSDPHRKATDMESVLDIIPTTRQGLDIDPYFDAVDHFEASQSTGKLLFEMANVPLVHGFLADQNDQPTWNALEGLSFDQATLKVAQADEATGGLLLSDVTDAGVAQQPPELTEDQQQLVQDGQLIQSFLKSNSGQLTYAGLFALSAYVQPGSLVAQFRSSHVSVLYRPLETDNDAGVRLYNLVTDYSFLHEPLVWASLADVEGSSQFCDANLHPIQSQTAYARDRRQLEPDDVVADSDHSLALQMQQAEYRRAQQIPHGRERRDTDVSHVRPIDPTVSASPFVSPLPTANPVVSARKKKGCIIC